VAIEELALPVVPRSARAGASKTATRDEALERLIAEHQRLVVATAYRLLGRMEDAQDAAQEVFLRLLKNLERIEGDPKPWLYR
jgi:DNA-directed RNA polymerase specialized sigma24 family protein